MTINPHEYVKGDANTDYVINIIDALYSVNILLEIVDPTPDQQWCADCNGDPEGCDGDGVVNILDTLQIINIILEIR